MKATLPAKTTSHRRHRPGEIWTDDELIALNADGLKHELWNGKVVTMCPAGYEHGDVITVISHALASVVYENKLGRVYDGQTGFRIRLDTCYCPDVSFVSKQRFKLITLAKGKLFYGTPDLAVEVLSPSDSITQTEEKVKGYLTHGTRLVWMVDPKHESVRVYRPYEPFELLRGNRILTGNSVVPGFRLSLAKIFEAI